MTLIHVSDQIEKLFLSQRCESVQFLSYFPRLNCIEWFYSAIKSKMEGEKERSSPRKKLFCSESSQCFYWVKQGDYSGPLLQVLSWSWGWDSLCKGGLRLHPHLRPQLASDVDGSTEGQGSQLSWKVGCATHKAKAWPLVLFKYWATIPSYFCYTL